MSGRHPSLEKLSRERMRFQRLAMSSPSDFVGTSSPMTELAANLNDVALKMSPDTRRRLSMDSASPGTPLSTITNLVRSQRKIAPLLQQQQQQYPNNKENVPITPESEDESSKDSGFCGSSLSSVVEEALSREASTSINQTTAELRSRPDSEPLTWLPEDSPSKSDGFELQEDFDLDVNLMDQEDEEEGNEENEENNKPINIKTLITNKVIASPKEKKGVESIIRPKPNLSPSFKNTPPSFRRSLSLKERECTPTRAMTLDNNFNSSKFSLLHIESPVSRMPITFKRPTSPADRIIKRRKIYDYPEKSPKLNRSFSEVSFSGLISAGLASSSELTGDMCRPVLFPIVPSGKEVKHHDLKPIDSDTLARLIKGEFENEVDSFRIIDARYVYEFEGGHIVGAENFGSWDEATFFDEFLPLSKNPLATPYSPDSKRKILIFHCEFSSVRGPELMKKLRQKDRCLNKDTYPALHYPECYLLHKGYKEFFRLYPELCEPNGYRSMADPNYQKDAKAFHKKSKSWAGGTVARTRHSSRPLNL
uniref:protein-tyrosine-phosphatase n=1 Tax=Lepeophtheirus salmonis TaxID=72036 RepID=A0A0K2UNI8_LEPSM